MKNQNNVSSHGCLYPPSLLASHGSSIVQQGAILTRIIQGSVSVPGAEIISAFLYSLDGRKVVGPGAEEPDSLPSCQSQANIFVLFFFGGKSGVFR